MGSAKRARAGRFTWRRLGFALFVVAAPAAWWLDGHSLPLPLASLDRSVPTDSNEMVWIGGGRFLMGYDFSPDPAARPQHAVVVRSFWLDRHEVTNAQFAEFVAATGYISTAERHGQGWVFEPLRHAWALESGADWRHPFGPHSSIADQEHRPVVLVSWYDAVAYAEWAGKRLPTEAEWEFAAPSAAYDADVPWGRQAQYKQGTPRPTLGKAGFPSVIWGSMVAANWPVSDLSRRTAMVWWTCRATFGNGAPIGIRRIIIGRVNPSIRPVQSISPPPGGAFNVAGRGSRRTISIRKSRSGLAVRNRRKWGATT